MEEQEILYEFREKRLREVPSTDSISTGDSIYLIMADRFSRYPTNDGRVLSRENPNGWHGGNIRGIIQHLDYIQDLGFTAIWITPLWENDMPDVETPTGVYSSYHGYAATNFYKIDSRFGSLSDYIELVDEAHKRGLKVVMDMIFNHCGRNHPWISNPPMENWINRLHDSDSLITNYQIYTLFDNYASHKDRDDTITGWFSESMPDLNFANDSVRLYFTQMTIWWIEVAGIDAIRMDTYLYVDFSSMLKFQAEIQKRYPGFTIIGETWAPHAAYTAKIQEQVYEKHSDVSFVTMDFAFQKTITEQLSIHNYQGKEFELYHHMALDFLYTHPKRQLAFLDNHDLSRWICKNSSVKRLKQALIVLLTIPRIPQVLYGTEILLSGKGLGLSDGDIRQDFPGGWEEDKLNKFNSLQRTKRENEVFHFVRSLLRWRRSSRAVSEGNMIHYCPDNEVYVYFRFFEQECVMVLLNLSSEMTFIDTSHYKENIQGYKTGVDVVSGRRYNITNGIIRLHEQEGLVLSLK
jgi:glycosidase